MEKIVKFIECNVIFSLYQKRYKKESYGCKYKILMNKMIMENG